MSPLRANHAHRCLHHGAPGDRPHPRSLPSYRSGEVPFPCPARTSPDGSRCGRFRFRLENAAVALGNGTPIQPTPGPRARPGTPIQPTPGISPGFKEPLAQERGLAPRYSRPRA